jgi:hypothetical protein
VIAVLFVVVRLVGPTTTNSTAITTLDLFNDLFEVVIYLKCMMMHGLTNFKDFLISLCAEHLNSTLCAEHLNSTL